MGYNVVGCSRGCDVKRYHSDVDGAFGVAGCDDDSAVGGVKAESGFSFVGRRPTTRAVDWG